MRRILLATTVALLGATGALAAGNDSIGVNTEVAPNCSILGMSSLADFTVTAVDTWQYLDFTYVCNFAGVPNLKFTSLKGGMENQTTAAPKIDYAIYLNDADNLVGPGGALQASNAT